MTGECTGELPTFCPCFSRIDDVNFTPQRIGYHDDADAHDEDGENYRIVSFFDASSVVAAPGRSPPLDVCCR